MFSGKLNSPLSLTIQSATTYASDWMLQRVQFADDLYLTNAGNDRDKISFFWLNYRDRFSWPFVVWPIYVWSLFGRDTCHDLKIVVICRRGHNSCSRDNHRWNTKSKDIEVVVYLQTHPRTTPWGPWILRWRSHPTIHGKYVMFIIRCYAMFIIPCYVMLLCYVYYSLICYAVMFYCYVMFIIHVYY